MKYIGIDLGTTNSAISSYDGINTQVFKSPEQYDVTPSAIYFDKRGNKYAGARAYNNASRSPENSATLFKRFMGTNTKIKIAALNKELTPEECSAEILKTLYGYLPEDIRINDDLGIVVTVPAAFNQMQKDATMQAAELAGLGKIALMQEPVAAVMSVMKSQNTDGIFLVYDLGGGTFDIAIAESISGKVNLLSHGGIAMCGGRDFDRALLNSVCKPWLLENFNLPTDFVINPSYKTLIRMITWAAEKAKIELSAREEAIISLPETELNIQDLNGEEIYIDISINRSTYNDLIKDYITETIEATREALKEAGLNANDIEKIVFIGGPTQYKPLRDMVSNELTIMPSIDVNPMTAVSEGAALFAESIDWDSKSRNRKKSTNNTNTGGQLDIRFDYISRTADNKAKVVVKCEILSGYEIQIDSTITGWTSGKMKLSNGMSFYLPLTNQGNNEFKIFVFDANGKNIKLENDIIFITKTIASINAIPASSSIGVEVKTNGGSEIDYWVKKGDSLPIKGQKKYRASESLKAGSMESINFKLFEGEITDPVTDNKHIGVFNINGFDFEEGIITAGADLIVDYEMLDSGNIIIEVTVPSISNSFKSGKNFYSKDTAQIDFSAANERIEAESNVIINKIGNLEEKIVDERLGQARHKINKALESSQINDPEASKQASDVLQEVKIMLSKIRKEHKQETRQIDLDTVCEKFSLLRSEASNAENNKFDNLLKSAQRSIDNKTNDFDLYYKEMKQIYRSVLYRQPYAIIANFNYLADRPYYFNDKKAFESLVEQGQKFIQNQDIESLRKILWELYDIANLPVSVDEEETISNILRGN